MYSAAVTVVFGIESDFTFSHGPALATAANNKIAILIMVVFSLMAFKSVTLAALGMCLDGLHHCVFKVRVNSRRRRLRHQNGDDLFLGIHPEVRPECAAPAKAAGGERGCSLNRIVYDADAQTVTLAT